jgi:hypothetical protein
LEPDRTPKPEYRPAGGAASVAQDWNWSTRVDPGRWYRSRYRGHAPVERQGWIQCLRLRHRPIAGTGLDRDGIHYNGTLSLRSVGVFYDQYLIGGFHVSPGVLVYDGNGATADATAPGGQSFLLGSQTYLSDKANPVGGTGTLGLDRKAAPALLFGFGNLLPRSPRHFSVTFDFGVVFQGPPKVTLNLNGSACNSQGNVCQDIRSNPVIQANIQSQQIKLNDSLAPFKYYPVVSLGFGYKF